jgi:hypothetical protein
MLNDSLKMELHTLIDNITDEGLLLAAKAAILANPIGANASEDDLAYLSPAERKELEMLAAEDAMQDAMSFDEMKKSMHEWRSKL